MIQQLICTRAFDVENYFRKSCLIYIKIIFLRNVFARPNLYVAIMFEIEDDILYLFIT